MNELDQVLYDRLPEVFPEAGFILEGDYWHAPVHFDLTVSRHGVQVRKAYPYVATCWSDDRKHLNLLSWYAEIHHCDTTEARADICRKLGLAWSESPETGALRELRQRLHQRLMGRPEGETAKYLREERGYMQDFIEYAQLGEFTAEDLPLLSQALPEEEATLRKIGSSIVSTHRLVIPLYDGAGFYGFMFRDVTGRITPKYLKVARRGRVFGLPTKASSVILVEGELDALRGAETQTGTYCALGTNGLDKTRLARMLDAGVTQATILIDHEAEEDKENKQEQGRLSVAQSLQRAGIDAFIGTFTGTGKVDVDTFLHDHTPEDLKQVIATAEYAPLYEARVAGRRLPEQPSQKEVLTYAKVVVDIATRPGFSSLYTPALESLAQEALAGVPGVGKIDLSNAEALRDARSVKQAEDEIKTELQAVAKMALTDPRGALARVKAYEVATQTENPFLHIPTEAEIDEDWKAQKSGIATPYVFTTSEGKREPWEIPAGALTFIGAQTSHGKTRLMENLALNLAQSGSGSVLYITYEEARRAIRTQMLNIYQGEELGSNNLKALKLYLSGGGPGLFTGGVVPPELPNKIQEFRTLLTTGRLALVGSDMSAESLCEQLSQAQRKREFTAVFVDYVQLLHSDNKNTQRYLELDDVCKVLRETAINTGLPVVLGAQLNREVSSPYDMGLSNIAQGTVIEQCANQVLLLWNSAVKMRGPQPNWSKPSELSEDMVKLMNRQFIPGQPGGLYVNLAKNREGERGLDAVLRFQGNTGRILCEKEKKSLQK